MKRRRGGIGRARRELRSAVARSLSKARGPEKVAVIRNPDGSMVLCPGPTYLWKGTLPNGDPFAFTTPTPKLEYSALIDPFAERLLGRGPGWSIIEHSDACRELGAGCICRPSVVRQVEWSDT